MKTIVFFLFLFCALGAYSQIDVKQRMPLTYADIAKKAADKWPSDFEMQKYTIDNQCKALNEYLSINSKHPVPDDIYQKIMGDAFKKWCDNDWFKCYDDNKDKGMDAYFGCMGADWEMIVYTMKNQFDAYNSLK